MKDLHVKNSGGDKILFSEFKSIWEKNNPDFADLIVDDRFISNLGTRLIEILNTNNMLDTNLVKIPGEKNKKHHILEVSDKRLLNHRKPSLFNLSMKLPMVCEPVKYTAKLLVGYLFNNYKYEENIFIDKKRYRYSSGLTNNIIYYMVNKTSATPFKVNIELLNYLNMYGVQQGLIMEPNTSHEFANKPDLKLFQKKRLISFNSKMTLQEIILDIAEMFSKFPRFYFPVRLDVRGRIYCMPNYFNYQSNELAKALILFADPSVIKKIDTSCIDYLISYGVNCFGGKISKQSLKKLGWAKHNKENIINFNNGILLNKAKDKLLFLAFCTEYKRFVEFMDNENVMEFHTYLPVQLDATCNGF